MQYVLDKQFTEFASNIWRPGSSHVDEDVLPPVISADGRMHIKSQPVLGPESDNERYFTVVWNSAKPSRWFRREDFLAQVAILPDGKIVGEIGWGFRFVESESSANGTDKFTVGWRME